MTPDFFRTLGVPPSLGRPFRPDDCRAGGAHALIISDRTWKDYFSGRSDIVGLVVRVDGVPSTIVGVMPPHFTSFMEGRTARVWAPMPLDATVQPFRSREARPHGRSLDSTSRRKQRDGWRPFPGVERVALTNRVPFLEGGAPTVLFKRAAGAEDQAGQRLDADVRVVDADFFAVMSIPLIRGRVCGRLLIDGIWRIVVGVVGSTIQPSPFRPSAREAFVPYLQAAPSDLKLLVQSYRPVASLASEVRGQVRAVDPDQPVTDLRTMEDALDDLMTPFRLILLLMTVFGTIALWLSAVGLYGVIAHDVSGRTREIGIRMAVGARKVEVVRMVVRDGLRLTFDVRPM